MKVNKNNYDIEHFHAAELIRGAGKSKGIDRRRHLYQVFPTVTLTGHVMEFGVYRGKTMAHIAKHFEHQVCWGFDSFVGLPEPWFTRSDQDGPSHPAGKFDLRLEAEQPVFAPNVRLVQGWFQDSLPSWLDQNPGPVRFLHIDCDLYSSTKTVLDLLQERIQPGTVIVFDEMYPWSGLEQYDLWAQGEYRALGEWINDHDREFETLFRSSHQQCSIRITR